MCSQLDLSTGQLVKVVGKASDALLSSYEQLQTALPTCTMVNIDETGHPENGQKLWTWGFHAPGPDGFTLFHIDAARSSDVLKEFLGETFSGVVGCDYHSAYRKFLDGPRGQHAILLGAPDPRCEIPHHAG